MQRLVIILLLLPFALSAQVPKKALPRGLNVNNYNMWSPTLSGDGKYMLYTTDFNNWGGVVLRYTKKLSSGSWQKPDQVSDQVDIQQANHQSSFYITYDGRELYMSSQRTGSFGKFDIYMSKRQGDDWGIPANIGKPVNSLKPEGFPSLSRDGKTLYFTRCERMTLNSAEGCRIMVSKKKSNGNWDEPEELSSPINTGHEIGPRIMPDNRTLIFSSARSGGSGGMDLYISKMDGDGGWTQPQNMYFLNTADDDVNVSVPLTGNVLYYTDKDKDGTRSMFMAQFPEEIRPDRILMIEGMVRNPSGEAVPAVVQAYDVGDMSQIELSSTKKDGSFTVFLTEGANYDFSVYPRGDDHTFYSQRLELMEMEKSLHEENEYQLKLLDDGVSMELGGLTFNEHSSEISDQSYLELQRLLRIMRRNPGIRVEIGAHQKEIKTDTTKSDPDLTEVIVDTTFVTKIRVDSVLTYQHINSLDSMLTAANNMDWTEAPGDTSSTSSLITGILSFKHRITTDTIKVTKLNYTYHNDRTEAEAKSLATYILGKGAPADRIRYEGFGDRKGNVNSNRDRWIEIKITY